MVINRWQQVSFDSVVNINPTRQLQRGKESAYIAMEELKPFTRNISNYGYRQFTGSGSRFSNNDVLLARITPCLENGKTAFVDFLKDGELAHGSTEFIVLTGKTGITDSLFIYYLVRSNEFRDFAIAMMEGTSGRQRVPANALKRYELRLPPLPYQKAIACILSSLDDKIELNQEMNRTLEAQARAIFKSWFVDFDPVRAKMEGRQPAGMDAATAALFPDAFEESELGMIPKGWNTVNIGRLANITYGAPFASKSFNTEGKGLPLVRIRDLSTNKPLVFTEEKNPKGTVVNPGNILVGMDGEFRAYLWQGTIALLNQRVCMFSPKESIPQAFLLYSLFEPLAFFERSKVGTTVIHLGKQDIDKIKIIFPDLDIFHIFDLMTSPLLQKTIQNSSEITNLSALRDFLLPKLMSGEIRVKDAEKMLKEVA